MYEAARSRGETAGLLEQLPEAADVFSTKLGSIPAGGSILVEISYVGELKHDAEVDGIRFTLPTAVAPRYGSQPRSVIAGKGVLDDGIDIIVDVSMGGSSLIQSVQSPSHPILVSIGKISTSRQDAQPIMHQASATLALGSTHLGKDFVLIVSHRDIGIPTAFLEAHPSIPNQRALMLDLVPKFSLPPARPEIIFVADRSGSMASEIPTLISALKVFLKSLPVGVPFNILSFGSRYDFLWPNSRTYDSESHEEAMAHIECFEANYGGTATHIAVRAAIERRFGDLDCEVLLLTDGDIWDQEHFFRYLDYIVGNRIRVFPLGIGNGVSSSLIEGVARAGKGFAQMVGEGEKLESKVVRMLKAALSPHVSDYTMEVNYEIATDDKSDMTWQMVEKVTDGLKVILTEQEIPQDTTKENQKPISLFDSSIKTKETEDPLSLGHEDQDPYAHPPLFPIPKLLQIPHEIPPLFPFARTTAYLLLSPDSTQKTLKSVILRGTSPQGPLELEIPIQELPEPGRKIHQLAAKKAMQELEEGRGWTHDVKDNQTTIPLKYLYPSWCEENAQREAVRLGVQSQVGGKWCSFVAVSENEHTGMKPSEDDMYRVESPVQALEASFDEESFDGAECCASEGIECEEAEESDEDMGFGLFDSSRPIETAPVNGPDTTYSSQSHGGRVGSRTRGSGSDLGGRPTTPPSQTATCSSGLPAQSGLFGSTPADPPLRSPTMGHEQSFQSSTTQTGNAKGLFGSIASANHPPRSRAAAAEERFEAVGSIQSNNKHIDTDSDKVLSIIELQDFEGCWTGATELSIIMGIKEKTLSKRKECYWITLVVIAFLEGKMDKEKGIWDLVVCKARTWLEEKEFKVEVLEAEARQVVRQEE